MLPILLITLSNIATASLYGDSESHRQLFSLLKSLTFAQVILLLLAFLYQPESIYLKLQLFSKNS
ncbi:hypothetical protein D5R40_14535 [Okeania hirsuta]|uniref:Uncharacterized protein n=1 Tax=Okeania hirsuta TaxID=1458930 RepID=A0A3N6RPI1_9CYAN|nr:hypothetical protein D5R40_14535 [Okeania hirsuta]